MSTKNMPKYGQSSKPLLKNSLPTFVRERWLQPFDHRHLASPELPILVEWFPQTDETLPRWNHYLVKERRELSQLAIPTRLDSFYRLCVAWLRCHAIEITDRYAYITVDIQPVYPGTTQRIPGWHIDGMQGDEVVVKKAPDLMFLWVDALPSRFSPQSLCMDGFNSSVHNIHRWVEREVSLHEDVSVSLSPGMIYAFDPYMPHTGTINTTKKSMPRTLVRLVFTHLPVTSRKMTINPHAQYDYLVHCTSGDVPIHLL